MAPLSNAVRSHRSLDSLLPRSYTCCVLGERHIKIAWLLGGFALAPSATALADAGAPAVDAVEEGNSAPEAEDPELTDEEPASEEAVSEEEAPQEPDDAHEQSADNSDERSEEQAAEMEAEPEGPRLNVQPPPAEPIYDPANAGRPRRDFLKRLRNATENLERVRRAARTQVRTEGDVTVLSNVAPVETSDQPVPLDAEESAEEAPGLDPRLSATAEEAPRAFHQASAKLKPLARDEEAASTEGAWRWLWILGGVATVLLVPIGTLLSRATRAR